MGLELSSIFEIEVDIYTWQTTKWPGEDRVETRDLHSRVVRLLLERRVLTRGVRSGLWYSKSVDYLALALVHSGLSWEGILACVDDVGLWKKEWYRSVYRAQGRRYIIKDKKVINHCRAFMETARQLGWKVFENTKQ